MLLGEDGGVLLTGGIVVCWPGGGGATGTYGGGGGGLELGDAGGADGEDTVRLPESQMDFNHETEPASYSENINSIFTTSH